MLRPCRSEPDPSRIRATRGGPCPYPSRSSFHRSNALSSNSFATAPSSPPRPASRPRVVDRLADHVEYLRVVEQRGVERPDRLERIDDQVVGVLMDAKTLDPVADVPVGRPVDRPETEPVDQGRE
jgi:hypothetical protein